VSLLIYLVIVFCCEYFYCLTGVWLSCLEHSPRSW